MHDILFYVSGSHLLLCNMGNVPQGTHVVLAEFSDKPGSLKCKLIHN